MTQSWFRMDPDGSVAGVSESDRATAEMNLVAGQYLLPADPAVNPALDRWTGERWEPKAARPRPEDDPMFMRRSGYPDLREQVGVLMKIAAHAVAGRPVPPDVQAEFDALNAQIAGVKKAHTKP